MGQYLLTTVFREKASEPLLGEFIRLLKPCLKGKLTDDEIRTIVTAKYNEYYEPELDVIREAEIDLLDGDSLIREFVAQFEDPAVSFENHMRSKYKLGPLRDSNYIRSATIPIDLDALRENFLEEFMEGFKRARAAKQESHFWRELITKGECRSQSPAFAVGGPL
jgi:hypothetical protein